MKQTTLSPPAALAGVMLVTLACLSTIMVAVAVA
jgi:hypothetical protein